MTAFILFRNSPFKKLLNGREKQTMIRNVFHEIEPRLTGFIDPTIHNHLRRRRRGQWKFEFDFITGDDMIQIAHSLSIAAPSRVVCFR